MTDPKDQDLCSEEWLDRYLTGRLSASDTERFEEFLLLNEDCQQKLTEHERFRAAMAGAAARFPKPHAGSQSLWRRCIGWANRPLPRYAAACAGAAAIAVLVMVPLASRRAEPYQTVELAAVRGEAEKPSQPVHAGRVRLELDARGLSAPGPWKVEVVNAGGRTVWSGSVASGERLSVPVERHLETGSYYVRIEAGADVLREFPLLVG